MSELQEIEEIPQREITPLKDRHLIFIDNSDKVINEMKNIVDRNWPNYFVDKRHFLSNTNQVEDLIEKVGVDKCFVLCDSNMEDIKGEIFLIYLRKLFPSNLILILYSAQPSKEIADMVNPYNIGYEVKRDLNEVLLQLDERLTPKEEPVKLSKVYGSKRRDAPVDKSTVDEKSERNNEPQFNTNPKIESNLEIQNAALDFYMKVAQIYLRELNELRIADPSFPIESLSGEKTISVIELIEMVKKLEPLGRKYIENWLEGMKHVESFNK